MLLFACSSFVLPPLYCNRDTFEGILIVYLYYTTIILVGLIYASLLLKIKLMHALVAIKNIRFVLLALYLFYYSINNCCLLMIMHIIVALFCRHSNIVCTIITLFTSHNLNNLYKHNNAPKIIRERFSLGLGILYYPSITKHISSSFWKVDLND